MPPVEFTFDEALSLLLLVDQIPLGEQIPYLTMARRAMQKIRSQLRDDVKSDIEQVEGKIQIDLALGSGDDGSGDVYEKVRRAILSRRVLNWRTRCVICPRPRPGGTGPDRDAGFQWGRARRKRGDAYVTGNAELIYSSASMGPRSGQRGVP